MEAHRVCFCRAVVRWLPAAIMCLPITGTLRAEGPMFDPVIDRPADEWCYAAESTTVIGMPFVPEPVQITYDGAVYTRHAELAFFYGEMLKPVMARNKTFLDGWIPVVGYGWTDGEVDYHLEIFSAELPELGRANLIQFARLTMTNPGESPVEGVVAAAIRGSAGHFRLGGPHEPITPTTRFTIGNDHVTRNGKLIYTFSPGAETYAVPDVPCRGTYRAIDHHVTDRAATGLAVYRRTLKPGEKFAVVLKMPRVPLQKPEHVAAVAAADYQRNLDETVRYWKDLLGGVDFEIPEKRVNDSYRASLVHLILATRTQNGQRRQGSGLPYDALFLNDYMDMLLAYDTAGLYALSEPNVDWLIRKQHPSGMFIDVHNRGNDEIVTSHGQGLFALAYHLIMTRDLTYGRKVYPAIRKGARFIVNDHKTNNRYGLIRSSIPYDAPMVTGYHTCHNLFALLALRTSIRAARLLGEMEDVRAWAEAEVTYRDAIIKAIDHSYRKEGTIRSGLYDWKAGWVQGRRGRVNEYPNQDWENNLLVYPTELLEFDDPRLIATLATIRARKYREGCMTYRNGMHVHQYVTLNQANQYRAIGDQRHALLDLYHVLLHNGSTHEGFENLVVPWSNRTPAASCPPPHAWAAAKMALFIRNMMVCEYGGQFGVDEKSRDLYLYSLISPSWMEPGKRVVIRNAPTEMGRVSSTLAFTAGGAELTVEADFHRSPRYLVFRVPYSVQLDAFTSDATRAFQQEGLLFFTPDVTRVSVEWHQRPSAPGRGGPGAHDNSYQDILRSYRREFPTVVRDGNYDPARAGKPFLLAAEQDHPAEPLSFDLVRRAFLKEYGRRFVEYTRGGGKPYTVEPPRLLDAAGRRAEFVKRYGDMDPKDVGIAVGKPVTASASIPAHPPELAVDGNATDLQSSWQTDPYPASLTVDLQAVRTLGSIHVWPYWGTDRYYRYTVEVSTDGKTWKQVGDKSKNTTPATPQGDRFGFDPIEARYIRVKMLYHSLNKGVHIVEVRAYGPRKQQTNPGGKP
ncbi:MAG: discoidin domain-containing protein [Candidatus Nealsonbacteria bacterium]|nr:discoidin domain-containing protein [Candidatus Nealsonbacteria bacterium]